MKMNPFSRWKDLPTYADFRGQQIAEDIMFYLVLCSALVGFIWGYWVQQMYVAYLALGVGATLSLILIVPSWPMLRSRPLEWQKPRPHAIKDVATNNNNSGSGKTEKQHKAAKKEK